MLDQIKQRARQLLPEIIKVRRHLHQYPELSFQEKETGKYIAQFLDANGINYTSNWGGHGIVAVIEGLKSNNKTIALRADIDALPIQETNATDYISKNPGVMHACGHDVHSASLLGAMVLLQENRQFLHGNVRCIFQPGEEKLPGGASILIKEGVLENPQPKAIFGQHVYPSLEAGKVGIRSGLYMASADEIYLTVKGKGGHGAMPQDCIDTILVASQILISLQQVVSRSAHPAVPSVLSFGKINSIGGATNIIPDVVKIEGTFRTMDENWRQQAHKLINQIASDTASAFGAACEVVIEIGYPCLINDPLLSEKVKSNMISYLGEENVVDLPLRMTSEDFAFYSQVIPACFYRLGTGSIEKGITSPVHTSTFDIDEEALAVGMGLMAWLAIKNLED